MRVVARGLAHISDEHKPTVGKVLTANPQAEGSTVETSEREWETSAQAEFYATTV